MPAYCAAVIVRDHRFARAAPTATRACIGRLPGGWAPGVRRRIFMALGDVEGEIDEDSNDYGRAREERIEDAGGDLGVHCFLK